MVTDTMEYSTLRLESEHEDICDEIQREVEEKRLARRRWFTLLSISFLFIISATILTLSVVHDTKARAKDPEWEEFSCKQNDPDCLHSLCPEGMVWDMVEDQCREMPGINTTRSSSSYSSSLYRLYLLYCLYP